LTRRILFICPRFHSNQSDMVRKLVSEGHDVHYMVVHATKSEDHSLVAPQALRPSLIGRCLNRFLNPTNQVRLRRKYLWPSIVDVYRHLFRIRPDVAVIRGTTSATVMFSMPFLLLSRCRIILYTQGPKYRKISLRLRIFYFVAFRVLRIRWFTPVLYRGGTKHGETHADVTFIPFFKYPSPAAQHRSYQTSPLRILGVGKYEARKNLLLLIDAISRLADRHPLKFTWIGEKSEPHHHEYFEQAKNRVKQHNLQEMVDLGCNLTVEEVQQEYLDHDLFVIASVRELASVAQLEAMSFGLPVICGGDNGTAHYVEDGHNGIIVDADLDSVSAAMEVYLVEPELVQLHGQRSLARLTTEFDVERSYQVFVSIME